MINDVTGIETSDYISAESAVLLGLILTSGFLPLACILFADISRQVLAVLRGLSQPLLRSAFFVRRSRSAHRVSPDSDFLFA